MRRNVSFSSSSNSAALGIPDEEKEREEEEKIGISFPPFPPPETGGNIFSPFSFSAFDPGLAPDGGDREKPFFYSQPLFFSRTSSFSSSG